MLVYTYRNIICDPGAAFEGRIRRNSKARDTYGAKERMLLTEARSRSPHALASRWDPVDVVVVGGSPFLPISVKRDRY